MIDIYEQRASVGGAWNYSPDTSSSRINIPQTDPIQPLEEPISGVRSEEKDRPAFVSPMYDRLETNIPNFLMRHSDKPFPADSQLFPQRDIVTQYLDEYADDVRHLIKFRSQVLDVQRKTRGTGSTAWLIRSQNLVTKEETNARYDAVAVASGHYTVPHVPDIAGVREWSETYPGTVSHSKNYRRPEEYRGKKVIIVGNSASGLDIGAQIGTMCRHPLLISQRSQSELLPGTASYKEDVSEIIEFLPPKSHSRAVRFKDGRVEKDIDAVLFCTGYLYSYPFLPALQPELITDGFRVQHLYQHIFYIEDSSLSFLALPMKIIPFPLSEAQAAVVARVWSGRLKLPSKAAMYGWEQETIITQGPGKSFHTLLFPKDLNYQNYLYDWTALTSLDVGKMPSRWSGKEAWAREKFATMKKAFAEKGEERHGITTMEQLGFNYDGRIILPGRDEGSPH